MNDGAGEGDAGDDESARPEETSDRIKWQALVDRIGELEEEGEVWVHASLFFDGNEDPGSMGCNLEPHPGMQAFRRVIDRVSREEGVCSLMVSISDSVDDLDPDAADWPFSDTVLVLTTADEDELRAWFQPLNPDDVYEYEGDPPSHAPDAPPGFRWLSVWWD
jgi:hypothetical protein